MKIQVKNEGLMSGKEAMTRDYELLRCCNHDVVQLFLYQWAEPTISLGRLQDASVLNLEKIDEYNVKVVSRPTGGRHIYHEGDLSISCVIPQRFYMEIGSTISARNGWLAAFVQENLQQYGYHSSFRTASPTVAIEKLRSHSPCFSSSVKHELLLSDRKVLGLAQFVNSDVTLIQGTIPFTSDFRKIVQFEVGDEAVIEGKRNVLHQKATALSEIQGVPLPDIEQFSRTLAELFQTD